MKALVLAGGKGTRLRPLTHTMATQLVPVANRPVLHYVMRHLADAGIAQVGVVISPEAGQQIRAVLDANPWRFHFTFILQEQPLGLAQAVRMARPFLGDDPFVMYYQPHMNSGAFLTRPVATSGSGSGGAPPRP